MTACVECGCFKARPGANTCKMCNDPITVQRRRSGIKARAAGAVGSGGAVGAKKR